MTFEWTDEPGVTPPPGATVLSSFPSVGFAATVAAHYMVQTLHLPRVGRFDSDEIPPIAVVQSGHVHPAVRVYGRPGLSLILSEFPPSSGAAGDLALGILAGAERTGARAVVSLEGVLPHPASPEDSDPADATVWTVTSHPEGELHARLVAAGARPLEDGVLAGVSGALLVAGLTHRIPVGVLLVSARSAEGLPDHRAGAALIEVLDRLLPELAIDTKPLRTQAELIEKAIRNAMKGRERTRLPPLPAEAAEPTIYQ